MLGPNLEFTQYPCGSELARDEVGTFDIALNRPTAIASKLAPTMLLLLNRELGQRKVQARFRLDQLAGVALLIRDAYGAKCTELPGGVVVLS